MKPIYTVIIILLVGVGAFYAGTQYQQSQQSSTRSNNQNGTGTNTARGQFRQGANSNMQGLRPVSGEIIAQDDKSITVKLTDGSSKIIILSQSTAINKAQQGVKSDLTTGQKVAIFGKENTDGSITAQNIQLNPPDRGMMNRPQSSATP